MVRTLDNIIAFLLLTIIRYLYRRNEKMKINKLALTTSLLLAMGFTAPSFAESAATTAVDAVKEVATDVIEKAAPATTAAVDTATTEAAPAAADCATQADFDAMSDADKAALTTPICETGADAAPADAEAPVAK